MIPELITTDKSQTRNALTALRKSHIKDIILFCDHRDLTDIMNEVSAKLLYNNQFTGPDNVNYLSLGYLC